MIGCQLKLRLKPHQIATAEEWLLVLTRVWNWAIRKIELDAKDGIYYSENDFKGLLKGHGKRLGISAQTIEAQLHTAWTSWQRCFKKTAKKPKLKGLRNKLSSVPFRQGIQRTGANYIKLPLMGLVKFHKQSIPEGTIKCARLVKRASGWHLSLMIDAKIKYINHCGDGHVGIDPGYTTHITLSTGEKVQNIKRFRALKRRIAQSQRGHNNALTSRLYERLKNQRRDDCHKLSRRLVEQNATIVFGKDPISKIRNKLGKSVADACHFQLRKMLSYKCTASGRTYIEVDSKYSTLTCSNCLGRYGPKGREGLTVRRWECSGCGILHDRDINSAVNTLIVGLGVSLEKDANLVGNSPDGNSYPLKPDFGLNVNQGRSSIHSKTT